MSNNTQLTLPRVVGVVKICVTYLSVLLVTATAKINKKNKNRNILKTKDKRSLTLENWRESLSGGRCAMQPYF